MEQIIKRNTIKVVIINPPKLISINAPIFKRYSIQILLRHPNSCFITNWFNFETEYREQWSGKHWQLITLLFICLIQFSSVQSLSHVWLFVTPRIAARQASLSITNSWSSPKLMSIELVMPSSHLILCRPLLLLPPIPPNISLFPVSQLFTWGDQSIGVSALASVLPLNTQDWSLEWTGWISLQSKGLSRIFSNTAVQKHRFFGAQLSLRSNSHIHTWLLEKQ